MLAYHQEVLKLVQSFLDVATLQLESIVLVLLSYFDLDLLVSVVPICKYKMKSIKNKAKKLY